MKGCYTAIITPFNQKGVDYQSLEKLIATQGDAKLAGVVPCGTTGESPTLSHQEHREVISFTIKQAKTHRLKVIAGAGSNSTEEAVGLAKDSEKLGADALLVVSPYYNKPTQEGIYQHYKTIAKAVGIEIVVYNIPGRTGSLITLDTIARLSEIKNITTVKEATGDIDYTGALLSRCPHLDVLSGNDSMNLPIYSLGGKGTISVLGNILPKELNKVYHLYSEGKVKEAQKLHLQLWPLMEALFIECNPIPIKSACYLMGIIEKNLLRLPLLSASANTNKILKKLLKDKAIR